MASAKPARKRTAKPADLEPVAEHVEVADEAPNDDFADEVAALASVQIVEDDADEDESPLKVQALDEAGEVIVPEEPPELYSAEEFRVAFRKVFDAPQHVPSSMPVVGPIFGPDWEAFAISPMTEPGFNATSDEVYAFLKKMVPSFLQKRENKVLLIGSFLVTQIYIAMSIIRARKIAAQEAFDEADAGEGAEKGSEGASEPPQGPGEAFPEMTTHGS